MEIIPAIDIRDGKCVRLLQGRYDEETIYGDDPVEMAKRWENEGGTRLHVVDLDGARAGKPANLEIIARIASISIKGVVAQNLFKRIDKPGRCAALEVLVVDTPIANLIRECKTHQIPGMIQVGKRIGNQPLDDAIMDHVKMKRISPEEAYEKALDKKKFRPFLTTPPEDEE